MLLGFRAQGFGISFSAPVTFDKIGVRVRHEGLEPSRDEGSGFRVRAKMFAYRV